MKLHRFAALLGAAFAFAACRQESAIVPESPPVDQLQQTYWPLTSFTLTERSGQPLSLADLKGKVWVADFFYSTCPGPCPMLSSRLSDLQKAIGADDRVRLVSISTDPERDTPEVLRQYAEKFQAKERWLFLTGSKDALQALAQDNFKLPFAEQPGEVDRVIHSTRLILVDQAGTIRGLYEGVGASGVEELLRDLRRLVDSRS